MSDMVFFRQMTRKTAVDKKKGLCVKSPCIFSISSCVFITFSKEVYLLLSFPKVCLLLELVYLLEKWR